MVSVGLELTEIQGGLLGYPGNAYVNWNDVPTSRAVGLELCGPPYIFPRVGKGCDQRSSPMQLTVFRDIWIVIAFDWSKVS